jgi:hypothetical protein
LKILIDVIFLVLSVVLSITLYVLQDQIYTGLLLLKVIISVVVSFSAAYFTSSKIRQIPINGR